MKYLALIGILLVTALVSGCTTPELKACGDAGLVSKLPGDMENLEMVKIVTDDPVQTCADAETGLKSLLPKMSSYAYAGYKLPDTGAYVVKIIKFKNEDDTMEALDYIKSEFERWDTTLQSFGMNKVLWATADGKVLEIAWKSGNHIITISNSGAQAQYIHEGLISHLLAELPSDNDALAD